MKALLLSPQLHLMTWESEAGALTGIALKGESVQPSWLQHQGEWLEYSYVKSPGLLMDTEFPWKY